METIQANETIELTATVLPGGRLEVVDSRLKEGEAIRVVLQRSSPKKHPSITELLKRPPRPEDRCFQTPEEADAYLEEERNSWDRETSS